MKILKSLGSSISVDKLRVQASLKQSMGGGLADFAALFIPRVSKGNCPIGVYKETWCEREKEIRKEGEGWPSTATNGLVSCNLIGISPLSQDTILGFNSFLCPFAKSKSIWRVSAIYFSDFIYTQIRSLQLQFFTCMQIPDIIDYFSYWI